MRITRTSLLMSASAVIFLSGLTMYSQTARKSHESAQKQILVERAKEQRETMDMSESILTQSVIDAKSAFVNETQLTSDELMVPGVPEIKSPRKERLTDDMSVNFIVHSVGTTDLERGAYSVNLKDSTFTLLRSGVYGSGGVAAVEGTLWALQTVISGGIQDFIVEWFMETDDEYWPWGEVSQGLWQLNGVASYDPWTDRIYAVSAFDKTGSGTKAIFVVDYKNKLRYPVTPMYAYGKCPNLIAAGKDAIYCIFRNEVSGESDVLVKVDKFTGEGTTIGEIGFRVANYTAGATIDHKSGRMFMVAQDMKEKNYCFWEINTTTGKATRLLFDGVTGMSQALGMWSNPDIADTYPTAPADLTATFAPGELSGTISFTAPKTNVGGENGSGELTYRILANGKDIATGKTTYGTRCDVPVTFDQDNSYNISVQVSNADGASRYARTQTVAGNVTPATPEVTIKHNSSGVFSASWTNVNTSDKGAPIDPSQITYDVVRQPGNVKVAEDIQKVSFTDSGYTPGDTLKANFYQVTAKYAGNSSAPGNSNVISTGAGYPALEINLAEEYNTDLFTSIDANGDNVKFIKGMYQGDYRGFMVCDRPASGNTNNDYLISPKIHLEGGMFYRIDWNLNNYSSYNKQKALFKWGKAKANGSAPTVADLNLDSLPQEIMTLTFTDYGHYVQVKETDDYVFAVQDVTTNDSYTGLGLYVQGFKVGEGVSLNAPDACSDITVTSSYEDAKNVEISFKTPSKTVGGDALNKINKIDIYREGELIKTIDNPETGKVVKVADTVDASGKEYNYKLLPYNDSGVGMDATYVAYIGIRKPGVATDITAWESEPGKIKLTWKAPATDVEGTALNPANVTYSVYLRDGYVSTLLGDNITETETTVTVSNPENTPQLLVINVVAKTEGGDGEAATVHPVAIGEAFAMPFTESFAGGKIATLIGQQIVRGSGQWQLMGDQSFSDGTKSYDLDGGMIGYNSSNVNDLGYMYTGKIDLTKSQKPVLTFYAYNIIGDALNNNYVDVEVNDGTGFVLKKSTVMKDLGGQSSAWYKIEVPIAEYAGKTIQLRFGANIISYTWMLLDNFRIREQLNYNLAILNTAAPASVKSNQKFTIEAEVENLGQKDAEGYTLDLYKNGKLHKTVKGEKIASGAKKTFIVEETLNPTDISENEFFFDLGYDLDEDIDDNISSSMIVKINLKDYPGVENLRVSQTTGNTALIEWEAPVIGNLQPVTRTEGFEDCDSWETENANGWTLLDADNKTIGGINGITLPLGNTASFFVLDTTEPQLNASWAPRDGGTKYLANMYLQSGSACDDWAISPELSGKAQKISFYARSYSSDYLENMECLYSQSDMSVASFKKAKAVNGVPNTWTLYTVEVPEGAKYFAIRCTSADKFLLLVDDITFESQPEDMTIKGYNVYRNGALINEEAIPGTSFTDDSFGAAGEYTYHVTPIYPNGEGVAKSIKIQLSGVDGIVSDLAGVTTEAGKIIVTGCEGFRLAVFAADGKVVTDVTAENYNEVAVTPGVYLVKFGNKIVKVIVK